MRCEPADAGAVPDLVDLVDRFTTSNRSVVGLFGATMLKSWEMPTLTCVYDGRWSVLAKPERSPLPKIIEALKRVPFQIRCAGRPGPQLRVVG